MRAPLPNWVEKTGHSANIGDDSWSVLSSGVRGVPGSGSFFASAFEKPGRVCLAVTVSSLLLYLLFPTRMYYWDGVGFALTIERAGDNLAALLHPNHLIYNLIGYIVWRGFGALDCPVRALSVLQGLNAFIAAATVWVVWRILYNLTGSVRRATEFTALFALSATWCSPLLRP